MKCIMLTHIYLHLLCMWLIHKRGFHSYTTTSSQGKFSCRLTERYAGSSPDKVIASHTGSKYSSRYLSGGTYYIRYEGNSHDAKTYAKLEK